MKKNILTMFIATCLSYNLALASCIESASVDALYNEASSNYNTAVSNYSTSSSNYNLWSSKSSTGYSYYLSYYNSYMQDYKNYQYYYKAAGDYQNAGYNWWAQHSMQQAQNSLSAYYANYQSAMQHYQNYITAASYMNTYSKEMTAFNNQINIASGLMTTYNASIQAICSAAASTSNTSTSSSSNSSTSTASTNTETLDDLDAETNETDENRIQYSGTLSNIVASSNSDLTFLDDIVSANASLSGSKLSLKFYNSSGNKVTIPSGALKSYIKTNNFYIIKVQVNSSYCSIIIDKNTSDAFITKDTVIKYISSLKQENKNITINGVSKNVVSVYVKTASNSSMNIGLYLENGLLKAVDL